MSKKQFKSKKRTTRANKKRTTGVKANTVVKSAPVTSEKVTEVKPVEVPKKGLILLNQHQRQLFNQRNK